MERTFLWLRIEGVLAKPAEYFMDMENMVFEGVRVYEDIVKVNYDANIEHVSENAINKTLKSCWSIGQPLRHYEPLIRSIACAESGLPFVALRYSY